jgi:hypothetical protein
MAGKVRWLSVLTEKRKRGLVAARGEEEGWALGFLGFRWGLKERRREQVAPRWLARRTTASTRTWRDRIGRRRQHEEEDLLEAVRWQGGLGRADSGQRGRRPGAGLMRWGEKEKERWARERGPKGEGRGFLFI